METIMSSVYGTSTSLVASVGTVEFLMCCVASIVLGLVCAMVYMFKSEYSKTFVTTLAVLPLIVQMIITLVNGNLGAGIAVMGVFNLVRFRSIPGTAKDIGSVFLAMAVGLATGMGFIALAIIFTIITAIVCIGYSLSPFGQAKTPAKVLTINVPEDLEFEGVFDDILDYYTNEYDLETVKTTNMGSMYVLEYKVRMREAGSEKAFIDALRCENGNCKISLGRASMYKDVL